MLMGFNKKPLKTHKNTFFVAKAKSLGWKTRYIRR